MSDKKQAPFIELAPKTPEHREFINYAVVTQNFTHLAALHNRLSLPIHLVNNWFHYALIMKDSKRKVVVIYNPEAQKNFNKFTENQGNRYDDTLDFRG